MQKTCIIVPCYNEEVRFPINDFFNYLREFEMLDFCFVNDGSTDKTLTILNQLKNEFANVTVLNLIENKGKAEAIRYAVLNLDRTTYGCLGYLDADLSTSLNEITRLSTFITDDINFIMGSRIKKLGSTIKRNTFRHIFGRVLATLVSISILKIPVYDTQCGAKIISTPLAVEIFKDSFTSKWLFDIELFLRIIKLKGLDYCHNSIIEIPLQKWYDKGDSRITIRDFIAVPFDLLKIYTKYR